MTINESDKMNANVPSRSVLTHPTHSQKTPKYRRRRHSIAIQPSHDKMEFVVSEQRLPQIKDDSWERDEDLIELSPTCDRLVFGGLDLSKPLKKRKLITVCLHGNETCGMIAVNELIREGFFKQYVDTHPDERLTIILGNPKAVIENKRFVDVNLNRIFQEPFVKLNYEQDEPISATNGRHSPPLEDILSPYHTRKFNYDLSPEDEEKPPEPYEMTRVQLIADAIEMCDEYIDLHSTSAPTQPFAIPALDRESEKWATTFSVKYVCEGLVKSIIGTSIGWATLLNRKAACFECGQHQAEETTETAKKLIKRFVSGEVLEKAQVVLCCAENEKIKAGFRYAKIGGPEAFQKVNYDEIIAHDDGGEIKCKNPSGSYIIMPTAAPIVGEEAWFWGLLKSDSLSKSSESIH